MFKYVVVVTNQQVLSCPEAEKNAVIVVSNPLYSKPERSWFKHEKVVEFDDFIPQKNDRPLDLAGRIPFSEALAKDIVDFVERVKNEVNYIAVASPHGRSRSAGIVSALGEIYNVPALSLSNEGFDRKNPFVESLVIQSFSKHHEKMVRSNISESVLSMA